MKTIRGLTLILCPKVKYLGPWVKGRWHDDNPIWDNPQPDPKSWGIKADLTFGYVSRPIPKFWHWRFWFKKSKEDFNKTLNPWMSGNHWFVLRIPRWIPTWFLGIGTPWRSVYLGFKSYRVNPWEKPADEAWTSKHEERLARESGEPLTQARILAPSFSIRDERD